PPDIDLSADESEAEGQVRAGVARVTPRRPGADAIEHTLRFPEPHTHYFDVESVFPTAGEDELTLFMAVWTPGSYMVREFAGHLENATGYFLLARRFREHVVQRGVPGNIVMLGSMYGMVASYPDAYADVCAASSVAYHALKGGVIHMTRHLAIYWADDQVRVNCLSPGPFPNENAPQEMVARLCSKSPMKRMGAPHELKGAVLFLASDASSYVTGQNLVVDGGWTSW
ncbi:MAG: SDR family oxidoreductase, partial [Planctomycetaceae bacterium]|nr:SDR family oxidoreductase [Planctomycetaceae bacterium]